MADEDSFSLDFTAPGIIPEPPPAPPPPPAPAPPVPPKPKALSLELVADERHPAPTVAAPAPAAAKPAPAAPAIPAPLLEAAQLHAAGDPLGASKKLEAALKTGGKFGNFTDNLWLALFEVLQDLNRRDAFDKLALTYAQHFEKSPPTWSEAAAAAIATTPAGVVLFRVPPELTTAVGPALKDLMQQARTCQTMEIDVSGVTTVDDAGATLAIRAIKALRDAKRETVLIGAENLAFRLSQTLEVMERRNEPQWHLLIAMYDSLGDQNAFEDAAVNYAVTFEVSPPSWEVRDRSNVRKSASPPVSAPTPPAGPALVGEVCSPCATIIQAITAKGAGDIMVDASQLKRIEAVAADEILACLKKSKEAGATITVSGLPPLPYILLTHHHWAEVATLKQRKL